MYSIQIISCFITAFLGEHFGNLMGTFPVIKIEPKNNLQGTFLERSCLVPKK